MALCAETPVVNNVSPPRSASGMAGYAQPAEGVAPRLRKVFGGSEQTLVAAASLADKLLEEPPESQIPSLSRELATLQGRLVTPDALKAFIAEDVEGHTLELSVLKVNQLAPPEDTMFGRLCKQQFNGHAGCNKRIKEAEKHVADNKRTYDEMVRGCHYSETTMKEFAEAKKALTEAGVVLSREEEIREDIKRGTPEQIRVVLAESIDRLGNSSTTTDNTVNTIAMRVEGQIICAVKYADGKWTYHRIVGNELLFSPTMLGLGMGTIISHFEDVILAAPEKWVRAKGNEYVKALRDLCLGDHEWESVNLRAWEVNTTEIQNMIEKTASAAHLLSRCLNKPKRIISEITEYARPWKETNGMILQHLGKHTTVATLSQDVAKCLLQILPRLQDKGAFFGYDDVHNDSYIKAVDGKPLHDHIMVASVFLTEEMLNLVVMVKLPLIESVWWTRAGVWESQKLPYMEEVANGAVYGGHAGFGKAYGMNGTKRILQDTKCPLSLPASSGEEPWVKAAQAGKVMDWLHGACDDAMEKKFLPLVVRKRKMLVVECTFCPDTFITQVLARYHSVWSRPEDLRDWAENCLLGQGVWAFEGKTHVLAMLNDDPLC